MPGETQLWLISDPVQAQKNFSRDPFLYESSLASLLAHPRHHRDVTTVLTELCACPVAPAEAGELQPREQHTWLRADERRDSAAWGGWDLP